MAHIVNLATQSMIKTYSQSKHYNPHQPHDDLTDMVADNRDEIGLIRSIAVKVARMFCCI